MKKIALDDLMGLSAYEKSRPQFQQEIIQLKKNRRVTLGDRITLVFENRKTVSFQIQEMLRAENITDLDKIKEEIDVYNTLIPGPNELSATMLLEIEDQANIKKELTELIGVDETVSLLIDSDRIPGVVEPGRKTEEKISAVQYVRFLLNERQKQAFVAGTGEICLVSDHPRYTHRALLARNVRLSLSEDLLSD